MNLRLFPHGGSERSDWKRSENKNHGTLLGSTVVCIVWLLDCMTVVESAIRKIKGRSQRNFLLLVRVFIMDFNKAESLLNNELLNMLS